MCTYGFEWNDLVIADLPSRFMTESLFELAKQQQPKGFWEREAEVIGGGFADGISRAGTQTWNDIKVSAENFQKDALGTTGGYLQDHWHEAAIGAAITFANPRKWVTSLLVAYSMRGLVINTASAAWAAKDSDANVADLRARYGEAISHEGTAFLSSFPMTMAGGMAGRAGATAVFGKNLGALDLLTGRVTPSQVSKNLLALQDRVRPPETKLLVSDMDNTLGSFSKYFASGVEKAIPEMAANPKLIQANRALPVGDRIPEVNGKLSEEWLYKALGEVMDKQRSHDYPWSVEMAVGQKLQVGQPGRMSHAEFDATATKPFWSTIDKSLLDNLHLFPQVLETLTALKGKGIPTVVLSDAPGYVAIQRLTHMGLDRGYVERLYALHNWETPSTLPREAIAPGLSRINDMLSTVNGLHEFKVIPKSFEKPHTQGFEALLQQYNVRPTQTLMVGDSRIKDVGVAVNAGARGLWARYGQADAHSEAVLTRLRPLPENPVPTTPGVPKVYPKMAGAIDSYGQVLNYLKPRADWGEIVSSAVRHGLTTRPAPTAALGFTINQPVVPETSEGR